jgi:hypothetical protein
MIAVGPGPVKPNRSTVKVAHTPVVVSERLQAHLITPRVDMFGVFNRGRPELAVFKPVVLRSVHLRPAFGDQDPVGQQGEMAWVGLPRVDRIGEQARTEALEVPIGAGVLAQQPGSFGGLAADEIPPGQP